jgi:uncharacterized protein YjbI with pentapeptide repeats
MNHPDVPIDLSEANLHHAQLSGANLSGADLSSAQLSGADLSEADLSGADLRWANLSETDLSKADLREADLSEAVLRKAYLLEADLHGAQLSEADLHEADLHHANVSEANLRHADLTGANLSYAHLRHAQLSGANLNSAYLRETNLSSADLRHADLSEATIKWTVFGEMDLSAVKGLETINHAGPSILSINTIYRSRGNIPDVFVRGTGADESFVEYMHSLTGQATDYYTCLISYSSKDQGFAERLYADLQGKGVRCWYAPKELEPGDYYHHKIEESIRTYDKLLLILSEHSIKSEWVEEEVKRAEEKEEQMDTRKQVLFPIRLDDVVMRTKREWVATRRFLRHIIDFTGWKNHDIYQRAFEQLLRDLKADF